MLLSGRLKINPHSHADNGNPQLVVRDCKPRGKACNRLKTSCLQFIAVR